MKKILLILFLLFVLFLFFMFMPREWRIWHEKAEPLPEIKVEEVDFMKASYESNSYRKGKEKLISEEDYDKVIGYLDAAEPTGIVSSSDSVFSEDYRRLFIRTKECDYSYYVFNKYGKTYLEIPYVAVYIVDAELFEILADYLD